MKNTINKVTVLDTNGSVATLVGGLLNEMDPAASLESFPISYPLFEHLTQKGNESSFPTLILIVSDGDQLPTTGIISKLKSAETTAHIPVIVFCDHSHETEKANMYQLKVNCYILKPDDTESLRKTVQSVMHLWLPRQIV